MRGPLTYLPTNPVYIGKVKLHDAFHVGKCEAGMTSASPLQSKAGPLTIG